MNKKLEDIIIKLGSFFKSHGFKKATSIVLAFTFVYFATSCNNSKEQTIIDEPQTIEDVKKTPVKLADVVDAETLQAIKEHQANLDDVLTSYQFGLLYDIVTKSWSKEASNKIPISLYNLEGINQPDTNFSQENSQEEPSIERAILKAVLNVEEITEFQFYEMVSTAAREGGQNNYDECYDIISVAGNRTISKTWINFCETYHGLDGTKIYNQLCWHSQFSGYEEGVSGFDAESLYGTPAYYAVLDYLYTRVSTNDFLMFNGPDWEYPEDAVQLHPEINGNMYWGLLQNYDLALDNYTLVRNR